MLLGNIEMVFSTGRVEYFPHMVYFPFLVRKPEANSQQLLAYEVEE